MSCLLTAKTSPVPQDKLVLQLRGAVQALRQDCHSLAGAVDRLSAGADVGEVLRGLPPTLIQVGCMP